MTTAMLTMSNSKIVTKTPSSEYPKSRLPGPATRLFFEEHELGKLETVRVSYDALTLRYPSLATFIQLVLEDVPSE